MSVPESLRQQLKDNRLLFGGITAALLFFTASYYVVLRSRDLDPTLVNNQILLFFLRNVNAVLVLAILFVLLRNLFKLWVERQNRILGSKFKTKLVWTYIGLTLIPVLLLFAYATELMQGSIENLFRTPTEELLQPGNDVAQALTSTIEETSRRDARRMLDAIGSVDLQDATQRPELDRLLKRNLRELADDLLAVYEDTEFVHAVLNPRAAVIRFPELERPFLLESIRNGTATKIQELPAQPERLILAAASTRQVEGRPSTVVVAGRVMPARLAEQTAALVAAYQTRRQLEVQESDIKAVYLLLFLTVTLVILLVSSWIGLYLARRVTVPIQALADATRRITGGDLQHRVQAVADDELGVLVDSFNLMTGELQRNREVIEQSNRNLVASNQRLDEERALIQAVLYNVAAGVLSLDREGRVTTCNDAALEMLHLAEGAVVGRPLRESLEDEARSQLLELLEEALGSRDRRRRTVRIALGGEWKTFEVTSTTMLDDDGEITGYVIVLEDLTELIKAQQLATWNEAARRVAHEIKNPLTPIKLSAERLLLKYRSHDPQLGVAIEEATGIIVREVNSMKSMVDEFSRFARMPTPHLQRTDLGRLLEDTVTLYREVKPGLEVTAVVAGDVSQTSLDGEQLRSALVNLIDNAVEATDPPGAIRVSAARSNGLLQIQVSDTGAGIPAEAKDKLFLPYYSTKGRGTGLGLAIVHRIVTDHHGTIRVDDNQPTGTVFTIELPQ